MVVVILDKYIPVIHTKYKYKFINTIPYSIVLNYQPQKRPSEKKAFLASHHTNRHKSEGTILAPPMRPKIVILLEIMIR
jgi:hypothetical protein